MTRIPIAITKDEENTPPFSFITMLLGTFIFGLSVGVIISLYTGNVPWINPASQLGAVGEITNDTAPSIVLPTPSDNFVDETITIPDETTDIFDEQISPENISLESPTAALTETPSFVPQVTRAELSLAIERLNKELERVKDESIELITSFNQSCANWKDVCATPYAEALEKNNASYERLTNSLADLQLQLNLTQ